MLDIKIIRNNPDLIKESIKRRGMNTDLDRFLELDSRIVKINQDLDEKRALKNKVSKEISTL
jgi:seryl-tRNA synthetase